MNLFVGFDIETRPRTDLVQRLSKGFPLFDETAVKCGNLKDPAKIAEKLAQAKADHEMEAARYWKKLFDEAQLNPFTGEVLVIGLIDEGGAKTFLEGDERTVLAAFWERYASTYGAARRWVFWSGCGAASKMFDLDFIVTRSRIVGVKIPPAVRNGRFYGSKFIDLASEFLLYQNDAYLSLTKAAEVMGLYDRVATLRRKTDQDEVTGANFHTFYDGTDSEWEKALSYLGNDLEHVFHLAHRIL